MTPTHVFETYWRFAAERQAMFLRRLSDPAGPWTADPILSTYRFTNTYRVNDRVSQYLIREVQYHPDRVANASELFFRTVLFKLFNRIETWEALEARLGPLRWSSIDLNAVKAILDDRLSRGFRVYSAAYIMPAPALGHVRKHANHIALLARMMGDKLPERIQNAPNLREVYHLLLRYPGIGPFLAYQYAIDLNYSELVRYDESELVIAGPGALDGISKCFANLGGRTPEEVIYEVCAIQDRAFAATGLTFHSLFGRRLQPIDCQNVFCEISKYARVAHPEMWGSSGRKRIKQIYRRDPRPLPAPLYPPRWNLAFPACWAPSERERMPVGLSA